MGQASSSALQVHVQLDQQCVHSGDVLRGLTYIVVEQALNVTMLSVTVEGKETCEYAMGRRRNKHQLLKVEACLLRNTRLTPGMYQFPIKTALPDHLPGTFSYKAHNARASIRYKVKVHVAWEEWSRVCTRKAAKRAAEFTVMERRKGAPRALLIKEPVPLSPGGRLRGVLRWELAMPTNVCTPGEERPLAFTVTVTNHAGAPLLGVHAEVVQYLVLKARGGDTHSKESLLPGLTQRLVRGDGEGGVAPNETATFSSTLLVPKHVPATVLGEAITSTFELRLSAQTQHGTAPGIRVPLVLNDPQPLIVPFPALKLPKQWQPHMSPVQTLASTRSASFTGRPGAPVQALVGARSGSFTARVGVLGM